MPILTIRHLTTYHYRRPVGFGEHRMMLRPRDDEDQRVLEAAIRITPEPADLSWVQDDFGNHVAVAKFAARASELRFESTIRLDHVPTELREDNIAAFARAYPFAYSAHEPADLARYIEPISVDPRLLRFARTFLRADGSADTRALVVDMTATIKRTFTHAARHEKGTQDPIRTLELARGSCRDVAVLMIAALRSLGIAARFVSGYLHLADDDDDLTGGNTHAWVQAYLPGVGWIDCDPSSGRVGNRDLVRVAVVGEPRQAIPLQGCWIGKKSDHLGMKVAVKVKAADGGAYHPPLRSMAS
jgi:transglutaminase-like putative cysteine protease